MRSPRIDRRPLVEQFSRDLGAVDHDDVLSEGVEVKYIAVYLCPA